MSPQRILGVLALALSLAWPATTAAKGSKATWKDSAGHVKGSTPNGHHVAAHEPKAIRAVKPSPNPRVSPTPVARDSRGRIQRSDAARHAFARQTWYPNGRPGWVIDHIKPLACGGVDAPSNMQRQTVGGGEGEG